MNWRLLVSDVSARIIGVFGFYVTVLTARTWFTIPYGPNVGNILGMGFSVLSLILTAAYLLPRFHDLVIERSFRASGRVPLVLASVLWLLLSVWVLQTSIDDGKPLLPTDWQEFVLKHVTPCMFFLFGLTIFPIGWAYSGAKQRLGDPGEQSALVQAKSTDFETTAYRKRDIWDHLIDAPVVVVLLGSALAYRFGDTISSGPFKAWVDSNYLLSFLVIGAMPWAIMLIRTWVRPPLRQQAKLGVGMKIIAYAIGLPFISFVQFFVTTSHGIPWVWNAVTQNPEATIFYQVVDIEERGRFRGCIEFKTPDKWNHRFTNCGLDSYWAGRLETGDLIEATGELSGFGHTFSRIEAVSN
ncbi:hypothetical protein [Ruegeria sp. HKCCD8929]|uniref:hypothetical protein n=1 Tax=Ruegeria sp. HKCCD8929 TaxID=2683006 RepID=UPI0014898DF5|nr:hypothetical protein [Ruegeria sp. HKCCD8929]